MLKHNRKLQFLIALLVGMALVTSSCAPVDTAAPQSLNPTVVVVQYVTQVVATVTPAPPTAIPLAEEPEAPVIQPVLSSGFDPYKVDIYYPLLGCQIASRLHAGDRAFAADTRNGTLGLHMSANIGDAPIHRKVGAGEVLEVIEGPFCRDLSLVWKVIAADGQEGFVAEGNGNSYWMLPLGEKVAADLMPKEKDLIPAWMGAKMGPVNTCGR